MAFPALNHVALTVRDLGVSGPWYQTLIGADPVLDEHTDAGFRHLVWAFDNGTLFGIHQHDRDIALAAWQQAIAQRWPDRLLRGLIHSDGCRFLNHVNGTDYPRYQFRNKSDGIRKIFKQACASFGVRWTQPRVDVLSVARRGDVARLDTVIGPKT